MSDRSWEAFEWRLARRLGTRCNPVTREQAGVDFETPQFALQAKLGHRFPSYLREWLSGIVGAAVRTGRIGVLVWKPKRVPDADAVVVLRFADWVKLHVGPKPLGAVLEVADRAGAPQQARQRLATLRLASICARPGCRRPLPPTSRRHGSARRFCSARCRWLAWRTSHPHVRQSGRMRRGAVDR